MVYYWCGCAETRAQAMKHPGAASDFYSLGYSKIKQRVQGSKKLKNLRYNLIVFKSISLLKWSDTTNHVIDIQVTKWILQPYVSMHSAVIMQGNPPTCCQGCGLGLDVSVSRPSRDVLTSRLGLVSVSAQKVSASRLGSRTFSSRRDVSSGAPCKTSVLRYKPECLSQ